MKGFRWQFILLSVLVFMALSSVRVGAVQTSTVTIGMTEWTWLRSSSSASRLVVEFGGGVVSGNPYTGYTTFVSVQNSVGVGGLYIANQIDELILLSYPRGYVLTVGDPLASQFDRWLPEAVAWAHMQGYAAVYGYGYSAGATLWMRYALGDEYGHTHPSNETMTGIIAKAYANQSCYECFQYASNYTLPILFLSGANDTIAPLAGVQEFYDKISSLTKLLITFPTDHNGMAEILPIAEQEWLQNEPITVRETTTPTIVLLVVLTVALVLIKRGRMKK